MTEEKNKDIDYKNWRAIINGKGDIQLNFKWALILILFFTVLIAVAVLIGSFQGYLLTLKPNLFWTIIFSIFSFVGFVQSLVNLKIYATILFFLATIMFFTNIFHPILN